MICKLGLHEVNGALSLNSVSTAGGQGMSAEERIDKWFGQELKCCFSW
jgi:hypothetical protein